MLISSVDKVKDFFPVGDLFRYASDDTMEPLIHRGDLVVFVTQSQTREGATVCIDDGNGNLLCGMLFRKQESPSGYMLTFLNGKYEPLILNPGFKILGIPVCTLQRIIQPWNIYPCSDVNQQNRIIIPL